MKRVLVTGASGFIGTPILRRLATRGYDVHALSRAERLSSDAIRWHTANLLDAAAVERIVCSARPTHLLHLAWITEHGTYWNAPENTTWLAASLKLLECFGRSGGERAVSLGTCAEYDWSLEPPFHERSTALRPRNLYGAAKTSLGLMQSEIARQSDFQQAWCRPFFLYGPGENPSRLVPSLALALLRGDAPVCREAKAIRDFLHVDDMAEAIATVLDSGHQGPINIASGIGIELGEIAKILAKLCGLSIATRRDEATSDVNSIVADVSALTSLGFRPKYSLDSGLAEVLDWWRSHVPFAEERR